MCNLHFSEDENLMFCFNSNFRRIWDLVILDFKKMKFYFGLKESKNKYFLWSSVIDLFTYEKMSLLQIKGSYSRLGKLLSITSYLLMSESWPKWNKIQGTHMLTLPHWLTTEWQRKRVANLSHINDLKIKTIMTKTEVEIVTYFRSLLIKSIFSVYFNNTYKIKCRLLWQRKTSTLL